MTSPEPFEGYVFGIGLGRTGSVSLGRALEELGIQTQHFPDDGTKRELLDGARRLRLLTKYRALVDGIQPFFRHLDASYPGSRFILTTRDVSSYVESRLRLGKYMNQLRTKTTPLRRAFLDHLEERNFGSVAPDAEALEAGFHRYHETVRAHFAGRDGDLLEMNVTAGDGWERLCPFLGLTVPPTKFPRANSSGDLDDLSDRTQALWHTVNERLPAGARVLLVDDDALGLDFSAHDATPFPHRDGTYWGPPADSESAVEEFEREGPVDFFVLAWPSFWWMHHYSAFFGYLRARYRPVLEGDVAVVFDCRQPTGVA